MSAYHHGYPAFPHPTAVYPLWPLLYGQLGRVMPMRVAGVWGPTCAYFIALIFAYLWAAPLIRSARSRSAPTGSGPVRSGVTGTGAGPGRPWEKAKKFVNRAVSGLGPGHALVLFLGLNGKFFAYTSLPYTEGLGYAVFFACL